MFGKRSFLLAYGMLFLFIIYVGFYGAQMNEGWEFLRSVFEWITAYILPWLIFVMLIFIYRKMK
ncbi:MULTISPECIES: hypothetical protein [unclassified Paenibacillus]|uniref:hypothetical protein n=1 Tax=unclassified Paenibacillus TaxID=185978 RepID=UPI002F41170C